jgi:hypothetical protein
VPTKSQKFATQKCNEDALHVLYSARPASTCRSSTLAHPHPGLPHTPHHTKTQRRHLSRRTPRSPSSQHPHQVTASSLRRPSRRLRPPRRRNSCGGIMSACCTNSSTNLTSSFLFSTRVIRLHDRGGSAQARSGGRKRLVFVLNKVGTCESPEYTLCASLVIDIMRGFARALVDLVLKQECVGMARTPPHNPNAPLQLRGSHQSAYEPCLWNRACISPPTQGVQTERGAEHPHRCRRLPECR